ncbi:MAG: SIR2 family protein [Candidatus Methylomirabilales bacterium]
MGKLDDKAWSVLLDRIQEGKCTPFLGAGVNDGILPLGRDIAEEWAKKYSYPLGDRSDLVRVAQFLAVTDPLFPKTQILKLLKGRLEKWLTQVDLEEFLKSPEQPLALLADLPLPVYITTNYDDLLVRVLRNRHKDPERELCCWNKYVRDKLEEQGRRSVFESESGFEPTPEKPLVFHLHGHDEVPESVVIAEDDYLEFLVNISRNETLVPPRIQQAMANTSLLFVGYGLADWNFRVLWKLLKSVDRQGQLINVAVQLRPGDPELNQQEAEEYLAKYFDSMKVQVYWGKARNFAAELRDRWEHFKSEGGS